jgi:catalase (peroxidase I)
MNNDTEGKCPVMHGSLSTNSSTGTSNKDWWPNQLNLNILHQHDQKAIQWMLILIIKKSFKSLIIKR